MAWTIVLSLLFLFLRAALSNPMFTPKNFEYTNNCNDKYLVEKKDILLIEFEANGSNTTYPLYDGLDGPQFYYSSNRHNNHFNPCSCFEGITSACISKPGQPNACSCLEVQPFQVYRCTYNMTAERSLSNQSVWMVWPGPPELVSKSYKIPEIRAKMELLSFQSSFNDNEDFLVAGEDTTIIQFEVSGNNSVHSYNGNNGPQFYYTTTDMVSHKGCLGFDPGTGSCTKRTGVGDACSCEMKTSNKYWLSYTKTATLDTSRATVYLLWPGTPDLRSDNYTFPEIKASRSFGVTEYIKIFIGVGLVALLATLAGVGIMCYKKYGDAEAINNNAQGLAPAIDRTQMETEHQKETVEKLQEADDEVQNLDTSENTVSSQTYVTSV